MSRVVVLGLILLPVGAVLAGCGRAHMASPMYDHPPQSAATADTSEREPESAAGSQVYGFAPLEVQPAATDPRYDVSAEEIREYLKNQTALVIDARSPEQFLAGHVPGAINVPGGQMESYVNQVRQHAANDELIIIYCNGEWCGSADMLYEYLANQGFTNMRVYKPGWVVLASRDFSR